MGDEKTIDLTEVPDKELEVEMKRREEIRKRGERDRLWLHRGIVTQFVDTLLLFIPKHDRASCSDEKPCNSSNHSGRIRCKRCELIWIAKNCVKGTHDNLNVSVSLDVFIEEDP